MKYFICLPQKPGGQADLASTASKMIFLPILEDLRKSPAWIFNLHK